MRVFQAKCRKIVLAFTHSVIGTCVPARAYDANYTLLQLAVHISLSKSQSYRMSRSVPQYTLYLC